MASKTTVHLVFVIDDEDFLERLREEELTAEELEAYAQEQSPNAFDVSTETDVDIHHLLDILGLRWSDEVEVEDLDGAVKLLDDQSADAAAEKLETLVESPEASARRVATILAEEFAVELDEDAIDHIASTLSEQDARAVLEEDNEVEASTHTLVQHLHALRTASEHGFWLATASYAE